MDCLSKIAVLERLFLWTSRIDDLTDPFKILWIRVDLDRVERKQRIDEHKVGNAVRDHDHRKLVFPQQIRDPQDVFISSRMRNDQSAIFRR